MKKILYSALLLPLMVLSACSNNNGGSGVCGTNLNLCFDLNGNTISVYAHWYDINSTRHRIYWEETSGSDYRNIEIDLYGSLNAITYTISPSASASGEASFQYYLSGSTNANYQGATGTVVITSIANNSIEGTFSGTVTESSVSYDITNGKIDVVPHQ